MVDKQTEREWYEDVYAPIGREIFSVWVKVGLAKEGEMPSLADRAKLSAAIPTELLRRLRDVTSADSTPRGMRSLYAAAVVELERRHET